MKNTPRFTEKLISNQKRKLEMCEDENEHTDSSSISNTTSVLDNTQVPVSEPDRFASPGKPIKPTTPGNDVRSRKLSSSIEKPPYGSNASILLIGFSGAGKYTLGVIASVALRRQYIDFGSFFESHMGLSPYDYMSTHGISSYREVGRNVTAKLLDTYRENHIIGGFNEGCLVERDLLKSFSQNNPVIYIRRNREDLQKISDDEESITQLWKVRDALYQSCSRFDFYNISQTDTDSNGASVARTLKLKQAETSFIRFLNQILGRISKPLFSVDPFSPSYTYALQVMLDWLEMNSSDYEKLECGADVINLIIDPLLYKDDNLSARIPKAIATLRAHTRAPIMIDIPYLQAEDSGSYFRLLKICLRSAPDLLTVSLTADPQHIIDLSLAKGLTKIIGVHHRPTGKDTLDPQQISTMQVISKNLNCYAVRMTQDVNSTSENLRVLFYAHEARKSWTIPLIIYNTGRLGRHSVCFNTVLSPVVLSADYLEGVLISDAQKALYSSFVLLKKKFAIFGQSVSYSLSPAMHNAAYEACGMPHSYSIFQSDDFNSIHLLLEDEGCSGVTVSLPFKVKVLSLLDSVSLEARLIGAVNTIVVDRRQDEQGSLQTVLKGYNTDHIGIRECIERNISPANTIRLGSTALIIGAGGMARAAIYSCRMLGVKIVFIYNRTVEHAQKLADYYGQQEMQIHILTSLEVIWPAQFRQPTIIISCIPAHGVGGQEAPDFAIPNQWLQSRTGGVFIELAYKPIVTHLIRQMRLMFTNGWIIVDGLSVLVEQGIAQFEIFTGRPAPVHVMRRAIREQYESIRLRNEGM